MATRQGLPSRKEATLFQLKAWGLKCKRGIKDLLKPVKRYKAPLKKPSSSKPRQRLLIAESRTPLYTSTVDVEWPLQLGKIENLRQAAKRMNGIVIPANGVFSFWKQLGPPLKSRGFVTGREVREGCVIPTIAGGICQLSNALYDCALKAGFSIHERHGHTAVVPGSATEQGRDATVFWNYVDLRFSHSQTLELEVQLNESELRVTFYALHETFSKRSKVGQAPQEKITTPVELAHANSCETCGVADCFRNQELAQTLARNAHNTRETVCLVDDLWPEYDGFLQDHAAQSVHPVSLFSPLNGQKRRKAQYAWSTTGYASLREFPRFVAWRSLLSRFGHRTPAARQALSLQLDKKLAQLYAQSIPHTATHLIVSQTLLPWLSELGVFGGRTYEVLMTRYPLEYLTKILDQAAQETPSSPTLGDFRCDPDLITFEKQALENAQQWITPHSDIARLSPVPVTLLPWQFPTWQKTRGETSLPDTASEAKRPVIGIIGPTLGRKGSYIARELVRRHPEWEWHSFGPILETPDFWKGLPVIQHPQAQVSLLNAPENTFDALIEPAIVEHRPRLALLTAELGQTVLVSPNCGLTHVTHQKITNVAENTIEAWESALLKQLNPILSQTRDGSFASP